jgi:hypothetical protein
MASGIVKMDLQSSPGNISRLGRVILSKWYDNIINEVSHSKIFILREDFHNKERMGLNKIENIDF